VPTKRRRPAIRSTHVPDGWHTVTPRLFVSDAKRLVAFLKRVFGATGTPDDDSPLGTHLQISLVSSIGFSRPLM
jgi:hypothetical protein